MTVTYLPVHWVPLRISPLASGVVPSSCGVQARLGRRNRRLGLGTCGGIGEALRWMGQGARGGRRRGSGGSCQGHWRELSADFRGAGRCSHGNHRPVTSLKKNKDKLGDFCLLPLHPLPGGDWRFGEGAAVEGWASGGWISEAGAQGRGCDSPGRWQRLLLGVLRASRPWHPLLMPVHLSSASRPCLENGGPPWGCHPGLVPSGPAG